MAMKSYKILQSLDKTLYPIASQLDDMRQGYKDHFFNTISLVAPEFISAIITTAIDDFILYIDPEKKVESYSGWEKFISKAYGKILIYISVFLLFCFITFSVIRIIKFIIDRKDNKGTSDARNKLVDNFYKDNYS